MKTRNVFTHTMIVAAAAAIFGLSGGVSPVRAQPAEVPLKVPPQAPPQVPPQTLPELESQAAEPQAELEPKPELEPEFEFEAPPSLEIPPMVDQIGRAMQNAFDRIWVPRSRFTDGPQIRQVFRSVVAEARTATVHVRSGGKRVALGGVVGPDGWVLTKASLARGVLTCRLSDGRELPARVVGVDRENDLAMLKIAASGLPSLDLSRPPTRSEQHSTVSLRRGDGAETDSAETDGIETNNADGAGETPGPTAWSGPQDGDWVVTVGLGRDPEAVGVVSVSPREIPHRPGRLGIEMDTSVDDTTDDTTEGSAGVRIKRVAEGSAAEAAELMAGDVITVIDGVSIDSPQRLKETVTNRSPGDVIRLTVVRDGAVMRRRAILTGWAPNPAEKRSNYQNRLGSELSERRFGFEMALQHDTVLEPRDCGGPLVDLDGRVVGFNISRAGRTESYALPAPLVRGRLYDLMSGRLAPESAETDADRG